MNLDRPWSAPVGQTRPKKAKADMEPAKRTTPFVARGSGRSCSLIRMGAIQNRQAVVTTYGAKKVAQGTQGVIAQGFFFLFANFSKRLQCVVCYRFVAGVLYHSYR